MANLRRMRQRRALESGFTLEPCATIKSALSSDLTDETFNSLF